MFYEDTILNDFKNRFVNYHILREKLYAATRLVFDMFSDMYYLHGVLDGSWCRMSRHRWRVCKYI